MGNLILCLANCFTKTLGYLVCLILKLVYQSSTLIANNSELYVNRIPNV